MFLIVKNYCGYCSEIQFLNLEKKITEGVLELTATLNSARPKRPPRKLENKIQYPERENRFVLSGLFKKVQAIRVREETVTVREPEPSNDIQINITNETPIEIIQQENIEVSHQSSYWELFKGKK